MSAGYSRVAEERVTGFIAAEGYDDLLTDGSDHHDSKAYGADGSNTARHTPQLPAALTPAQPLQMVSSLCHGYWILISGTPVMWTRACDYYVFALRKLLI